ncbi:hypothetical protein [Lutibacter sp.]|uniref:hypothetical protein n=1 Tax=Lutibacter sp. TaxID=1925666 RepID=UPI0025BB294F|nr:hypothetical protein [Lutibacter sp.]MCF6182371.1 hypothetical protein [Lutibacter sp.]
MLLVLLLYVTIGTAQQLYIEAGKTVSSFDYHNNQDQTLDNLQSTTHSFMALGYKDQLFIKKLKGSLGIAYAGYGAIGSDNVVGNFMEWDVNYLEFNAGLDYEMFNIKKAVIYIKGTTSAGFLVNGNQTLNNKVINLKKVADFNKTVFNLGIGLGFSHPISENLSFYAQYMYRKSLTLKSGTVNNADLEELKIISHNLSFGLLINISDKF